MKKFVKLFAIMLCAVVATAALVGCGGNTVPLTEENVAGKWELTYATYTPHAQSEYAADTCTKAEWEALASQTSLQGADSTKFDIFEDKFYTYELRANHKIYVWFEGTAYEQNNASWAIEDGQLTFTGKLNGVTIDSVTWDNGVVTITYSESPEQSGIPGTFVFTLEKVVETA